ncbi:NAD-dependent epimerase/dehydratase family protein [Aestuariibacter halophilus]|uniref:NAD-dependent epimerase/dehydratase family protein n=1 Tax=Fluctibacter halophilus TaxID=226011 RepID=A0ABS8GCA1_9ALTE|nr:NAD-dependent epimerase/dehydratase family protein [Aestuariibacter halophilus]MCC2617876.1 NAD-dependent epimerase/dehydratase family protein [Aestuariibacter halophilus]
MTPPLQALVAGATGLVGQALVKQLSNDSRYRRVHCLVRREGALNELAAGNTNVIQHCTDFKHLDRLPVWDKPVHVYICLGTTLKTAGSASAFRAIDHDLVIAVAREAVTQQAISVVWISSVGANAGSRNLYLRTKGEVEDQLARLSGQTPIRHVNPSLLLGAREDSRPAEAIGQLVAPLIAPLCVGPLAKWRPVRGEDVAGQMIALQEFRA